MKDLIPMDDFGVFCGKDGKVRANSLYVANTFEKEHKHVLRDIAKITEPKSGLSETFRKTNFGESYYKDSTGRKLPCYSMTRDGFTMLVMGYSGQKAMAFKEAYIRRFNEMEQTLLSINKARADFPRLTESIRLAHDQPKPYHFSNECDMLNRIVLGMTAKQFKMANGLPLETTSIRPYLSNKQIAQLAELEAVDIGLVLSVPSFEERKRTLEWYVGKKFLN